MSEFPDDVWGELEEIVLVLEPKFGIRMKDVIEAHDRLKELLIRRHHPPALAMPESVRVAIQRRIKGVTSAIHSDDCPCSACIYMRQIKREMEFYLAATPLPTAMDAPDGEGWWAFEGRWVGIKPVIGVCREVQEVIDDGERGLGFYQLDGCGDMDFIPVATLTGKWWRIALPWHAEEGQDGTENKTV